MRNLEHGVRWVDGEFVLRCPSCSRKHLRSFWPLTLEFWWPAHGLTKCRACWQTYYRLQRRKLTPEQKRERHLRWYASSRDYILWQKRQHYQENRERILAQKRAAHAARKQKATRELAA